MGRSRIQGNSTECNGSECDREATMVRRPSWGFAPWRVEGGGEECGCCYQVTLGLTSVIPAHCTGLDRRVDLTGYRVCVKRLTK
jgi:hypothetical protein